MYSVLNKLSEYTYFWILKDISSYTLFCLFLKSLEAFSLSLQDFDKNAQEISVFSKFGWEMKKERKNVGQAGRCGQSGR